MCSTVNIHTSRKFDKTKDRVEKGMRRGQIEHGIWGDGEVRQFLKGAQA
jgi:hypothetical protein